LVVKGGPNSSSKLKKGNSSEATIATKGDTGSILVRNRRGITRRGGNVP